MRFASMMATVLLLAAPPAVANGGKPAAEGAAREVQDVEERLGAEVGLADEELGLMRYAVRHHLALGGDPDSLVLAADRGVRADCRRHCLVFVVEAMTMTLRAELPPGTSLGILDRALRKMTERRDSGPRCWTDIEQGAWTWVQVDTQVQRVLANRDDPA